MKIIFSFDPNCTDPNSQSIPLAELWIEDDHSYQFGWLEQPEALSHNEATIQLLRDYPRLVRETMRAAHGKPISEIPRLFGAGGPPLTVFVSDVTF